MNIAKLTVVLNVYITLPQALLIAWEIRQKTVFRC